MCTAVLIAVVPATAPTAASDPAPASAPVAAAIAVRALYGSYGGTQLQIWDCHSGSNQRWSFV